MPFKTLLLIPPKYEVDFPPLGTPALAGFLKSRGKFVAQMDANHAYHLHFMNKLEMPHKDEQPRAFKLYALRLFLNSFFVSKEDSDVYYAPLLKNCFAEASYNDWTDSSYHFAENLLDSEFLRCFLEDEKENTFLQYYRDSRLGEHIVEQGINLLGISVIGPSQVIATLTLAKYLKMNFAKAPKIVVGGQWCTLFHSSFVERNDFTDFVDFHIRGEGETPLLSLIQYLEGERPVEDAANLSFAKNGQWQVTAHHTKENLRELPAPDFDGLPLREYDSFGSSKIHLTYETSRECYWNRCTYCVDLPMPHEGYRAKPVAIVLKEIKELKDKYHFDALVISDPAIAPSRLRDISQGLIDRGERIPFWCFGRLEKNFTKEIFETAKKAGCYVVNFGMETANQRIMDFVDKGTQLSEVGRIIKDCAGAGVHVALQMIMRLPTETFMEGLETVIYLINHRAWIQQATFNIYYCTPGSLMFNDPFRFKIRILPNQPRFRFFHVFEMEDPNSMAYDEAQRLIALYKTLIKKDKPSLSLAEAFQEAAAPSQETEEAASENLPADDYELVQCALSLGGGRIERGLIINPEKDDFGYLTREQMEMLSEDHLSLSMAHDIEAKRDTIRELIQLGLLRKQNRNNPATCP